MSSLNNPLQSTIFVPPNSNADLLVLTGTVGNPAGYGNSQVAQFTAPTTIPIGSVTPIQIVCPKPAPLWAVSTESQSDALIIKTISNQSITLQQPSTITGTLTGFNNGYFQPSAGQTYIFYYVAGTARPQNGNCFELQAVVENTIGQYVDLGSITPTTRTTNLGPKSTFQLGTTVSLNTTSTLANTVYVDFQNWPVNAGRNTLATGIALLTAQANRSISSAFTNNAGSSWEPFQIIGGQTFAFEVQCQREGYWTGRISIAITQVGIVSLSPTMACTSVFQPFGDGYSLAGNSSAGSQDIDANRLLMAMESLNLKVNCISNAIEDTNDHDRSNDTAEINQTVSDLSRKNELAHQEIFRQLTKIMKKVGLSNHSDDTQSVTHDDDLPESKNILPKSDSNETVVRSAAGSESVHSNKRMFH